MKKRKTTHVVRIGDLSDAELMDLLHVVSAEAMHRFPLTITQILQERRNTPAESSVQKVFDAERALRESGHSEQ